MKHDLFAWNEVPNDEKVKVGKGRVFVRLTAPAALLAMAEGVESCIGYGTQFEVQLSEAAELSVVGDASVRWFVRASAGTSLKSEGVVFTNPDRMVNESGSVAEVTRALRMLELQKREAIRAIRNEQEAADRRAQRRAERQAERQAEPVSEDPEIEPAAPAEPEPLG